MSMLCILQQFHGLCNFGIFLQVFKAIVMSGQAYSKQEKSLCELSYKWHDKKYLGAAHGFAGIFFILMQVELLYIHRSTI